MGSMEKNCGNCRNWDIHYPSKKYGECREIVNGADWLAAWIDSDEGVPVIYTRPNFSCSLFEQKGEE